MKYTEIITSITKKKLEPIYFLMGDEFYYIDLLADYFAKNILSDEEKVFNLITLYGKDTSTEQIINEAKLFPFGAKKRIVIIKEAQHLSNIDHLTNYLDNPSDSTVLIICYKGKSIDKRTKFGKTLNSKCVVFISNKLYENQIPEWIENYIHKKGYKIHNNATAILSEQLGTNLSKIANEINKLMLVADKKELITSQLIEDNIGISKDYNIFELQNALGARDILKSNKIINHFANNSKNHHLVPIISALFSYFEKILMYHSLKNKNRIKVASTLKINPFFVSQYEKAAKNYTSKQLSLIVQHIKNYDLRSKGVNNKSITHNNLLRELVFNILHA